MLVCWPSGLAISNNTLSRQTQAIIHADAIIHNFDYLCSLAPQSQTMVVIKADAYGHGAINVARILRNKAPAFAVAITEEAIKLREAGIDAPIVVLEGPHQEKECLQARDENLTIVVHDTTQLEWVKRQTPTQPPGIWLKVDTGMHRLGMTPEDAQRALTDYSQIIGDDCVLVTHMASADDTDNPATANQLDKFARLVKQTGLAVSIANSPATLGWPASHGNWNRVGLGVFGSNPMHDASYLSRVQPAMTLRASVIALRHIKAGEYVGYGQAWQAQKDSIIATIGIGYADGYPRHCSNGTPVLVNGQRAPLAGRVSMDMLTVDVTEVGQVQIGDFVELWGENLRIDEVAACAGTISYELMTRVSPRVPRVVRYR